MTETTEHPPRRLRADAQRNADALLVAAKVVFAESGVDAPAKEITDLAGVGVGTLYRHFPLRSDLIIAVLQHELDACIALAAGLTSDHEPTEALSIWLHRYTELVATKQGLAAALHSGDPAYDELPSYIIQRLEPVLESLLDAASGEIKRDMNAKDLLRAVAQLCVPTPGAGLAYSQRMVALLIDGLRAAPTP